MDINVSAPINQLGYGIFGINLVLALQRLGHTPALWCIGGANAPVQHAPALRTAVQRTLYFNADAPSLRCCHQFDLAQHVGNGPKCGFPVFELDRFKAYERHHLLAQDLLFVTCRWAGQVLLKNGIPEERIRYAPLGVDLGIFHPPAGQPAESGTTVFMNVGKWELRKGQDILLNAFCKAFSVKDDVRLEMYCYNPTVGNEVEIERYNRQWSERYRNSPLKDKIRIASTRFPSQVELAKAMAGADCGVFPARAEGWNLDLCEMMAMGKYIIATNYSAHTEYLSPSNAFLVQIDQLVDAHDGHSFDSTLREWQGKPGQWAKLGTPQLDQLVEHMRKIHQLKQQGQLRRNDEGIETMKRYTWEHTAKAIVNELK